MLKPGMKNRTKAWRIYALTLTGILVWLTSLGLAPYFRSRGIRLNSLIYSAFAPTCHQIPSRSFHICGFPLAVCGRCTGIYVGFLAGMLAVPLLKAIGRTRPPTILPLIVWTFPLAADAAANFFGIWSSGIWLRFGVGFLWGTILPFYLLAGLNSLFLREGPEKSGRETGSRP